MPVLFLGHGSPMNAIEENAFTAGWKEMAKEVPRPEAILCISAHWETRGSAVTAMARPRTIHDFGGFPRGLYEVQYPAPGSPELAEEVRSAVTGTEVTEDHSWGLDHGCWSVLKHMYPAADIPVVQLSLDYVKTPLEHYHLGAGLYELRKKGVLIAGSGNMVHNLGKVAWDRMDDPEYGYGWAIEANDRMKSFIRSGDHDALIGYEKQGDAFRLAVPTPEHFLPLLCILALKQENEEVTFFNDKTVMGSLAMTSVLIK